MRVPRHANLLVLALFRSASMHDNLYSIEKNRHRVWPEGVPGAVGVAITYFSAALVVMAYGLLDATFSTLAGFLLGCVVAGRLVRRYSRIEVEIGWVGVGSLLLGIFCIAMWAAGGRTSTGRRQLLLVSGTAAGFCVLPLSAYRPLRSKPAYAALGMLIGAVALAALLTMASLRDLSWEPHAGDGSGNVSVHHRPVRVRA